MSKDLEQQEWGRTHHMPSGLAYEAKFKPLAAKLFRDAGFSYDDSYSTLEEKRPYGVDCFLYENRRRYATLDLKFDTYKTGRVALEAGSNDDSTFTSGWMFTGQMGWLGYWLVASGEFLVVHMNELRRHMLENPLADRRATTAYNQSGSREYISWNLLHDLNTILKACPSARVVDVRHYGKDHLSRTPHIVSKEWHPYASRVCGVRELVAHMRCSQYPSFTSPLPHTPGEIVKLIQKIQPFNLMKNHFRHAPLTQALLRI